MIIIRLYKNGNKFDNRAVRYQNLILAQVIMKYSNAALTRRFPH